jgi:hypothetical protein
MVPLMVNGWPSIGELGVIVNAHTCPTFTKTNDMKTATLSATSKRLRGKPYKPNLSMLRSKYNGYLKNRKTSSRRKVTGSRSRRERTVTSRKVTRRLCLVGMGVAIRLVARDFFQQK